MIGLHGRQVLQVGKLKWNHNTDYWDHLGKLKLMVEKFDCPRWAEKMDMLNTSGQKSTFFKKYLHMK